MHSSYKLKGNYVEYGTDVMKLAQGVDQVGRNTKATQLLISITRTDQLPPKTSDGRRLSFHIRPTSTGIPIISVRGWRHPS